MMDSEADLALLERWSKGDAIAGAHLVDRHFSAVQAFLRRRLTQEEVDDLVQQTFLACLERPSRFRRHSAFRTFLLGIARHQLFAHRRRANKAGQEQSLDPESLNVAAPASSSVRRCYLQERQEGALGEAICRLTPPMRSVIELSYWHGLAQDEIARILDIPVGTVASRLRRAKEKLRDLMRTPLTFDGADVHWFDEDGRGP